MATGFGTNISTMHQAAQHVRDVNHEIQADLSRLAGQLDPLQGAWKGGAAVAFHKLRVRWDADARKLNDALSHIAAAIDVTKGTYAARDQQSSETLSHIASALG
ncbi:MAG: WXG100 family type VII secretion target [Pseudonocardiales bacterium]|nr:MAG: WXG100 family type VII secretion target [Pseudonocardiales bacterium]